MKNIIYFLFCMGLMTACSNMGGNAAHNDKASDNKKRVQEFYDQVINAHNVNMIDSFVTADFVDHNPEIGYTGKGSDDLKAQFTSFFAAFPDIKATTHFMVACGDTVVTHLNMSGTNSGPMGPGMPATNKTMSIDGIDIVVIKDGRGVERWGFFDSHKMMQDLGMMGEPMTADTTAPAEMQNQ